MVVSRCCFTQSVNLIVFYRRGGNNCPKNRYRVSREEAVHLHVEEITQKALERSICTATTVVGANAEIFFYSNKNELERKGICAGPIGLDIEGTAGRAPV